MIRAILTWWIGQLADLLPGRLKPRRGSEADALIVTLPPAAPGEPPLAHATLSRRRDGIEAGRGPLDGDSRDGPPGKGRVHLRVPPGLLLECQLTVPLAAERALDNVLRYEMQALTPFPPEQLYWSAETVRRDTRGGKLILRLSMIPMAALAAAMAALRERGLPPAALEIPVAEEAGRLRLIDLSDRHVVAAGGRTLWRDAALCGGLALAAAVLPFLQQGWRADGLDRQLAKLAAPAARAAALRREVEAASGTGSVLAAARAQAGDPLAVLAAVTQALPDSSYLTELTLNHRQLGISGEAAAAAPLLSALSARPPLAGVTFAAPVTRDGDLDVFSIQATVSP